jgi:hypothetical protein
MIGPVLDWRHASPAEVQEHLAAIAMKGPAAPFIRRRAAQRRALGQPRGLIRYLLIEYGRDCGLDDTQIEAAMAPGLAAPVEVLATVPPTGLHRDAASLAGKLLVRGVDPQVVAGMVIAWGLQCRPIPMAEPRALDAVAWVAARELERGGHR